MRFILDRSISTLELTIRRGDIFILGTDGEGAENHLNALLGIEKQFYVSDLSNYTQLTQLIAMRCARLNDEYKNQRLTQTQFLKRKSDWAVILYELTLIFYGRQKRLQVMSSDKTIELGALLQPRLDYALDLINQLIHHPNITEIERIYLHQLIPLIDLHSFILRLQNLAESPNFFAKDHASLFANALTHAQHFSQLTSLAQACPEQSLQSIHYRFDRNTSNYITTSNTHAAVAYFVARLQEQTLNYVSKRPYCDVVMNKFEEVVLHQTVAHSEEMMSLYKDIDAGIQLEAHLQSLENAKRDPKKPGFQWRLSDYNFSRARTHILLKKIQKISALDRPYLPTLQLKVIHEMEFSMQCLEALIENQSSNLVIIEICLMLRICNDYIDTIVQFAIGFNIDSALVEMINKIVDRHLLLIPILRKALNYTSDYSVYVHRMNEPTKAIPVPDFFNVDTVATKFAYMTDKLTNQCTLVKSNHRLFMLFKMCSEYILQLNQSNSKTQQEKMQGWLSHYRRFEKESKRQFDMMQTRVGQFEIYYFWIRAYIEGIMCSPLMADPQLSKSLKYQKQEMLSKINLALALLQEIDYLALSPIAITLVQLYELDIRNFHGTILEVLNNRNPSLQDYHAMLQAYFALTTRPQINLRESIPKILQAIEDAEFVRGDTIVLNLFWESVVLSVKLPLQRLLTFFAKANLCIARLPFSTMEKIYLAQAEQTKDVALVSEELMIKFFAHCYLFRRAPSDMTAIMLRYAQMEWNTNESQAWQSFSTHALAVEQLRLLNTANDRIIQNGARLPALPKPKPIEPKEEPRNFIQHINIKMNFKLFGPPVGINTNLKLILNALLSGNDTQFWHHLAIIMKNNISCAKSKYSKVLMPQKEFELALCTLKRNSKTIFAEVDNQNYDSTLEKLKNFLIQTADLYVQSGREDFLEIIYRKLIGWQQRHNHAAQSYTK